jgi:hypothetical protein
MVHRNINLFKILLLTLFMCSIYIQPQLVYSSGSIAKIVGVGSPVQVRRGSVIRATASIKNTGDQARTFYVGASIIGEGETAWKNLPSWGTTTTISAGYTGYFTFGDYTIPSDAYIGYHGIIVKVWTDSSKATLLDEEWYAQQVLVSSVPSATVTSLSVTIISY